MPNTCTKTTRRCAGQDHPKAELSDRDVELMRQLHEEYPNGHPKYLGYRKLAVIFAVSRDTVRAICLHRRR